ncbi:MAG TPA: ATP synthase subunit I [Pyrinomonadaceae bacterium]|nr:ATP synthase subunit I [Pyrinomonadaceae bacterium]
MSEDSDSIEIEQPQPPPISHRRILWMMALVAVAGSLAGFIFVSWQFGVGVILGGILSLVNYYWLKVSLKRLFDSAVAHGEKPRFLAVRYFARYATLGAILTVVFLTKIIPVVAVIAGLGSFALAIVIEGFIRLFSTFFKSREL